MGPKRRTLSGKGGPSASPNEKPGITISERQNTTHTTDHGAANNFSKGIQGPKNQHTALWADIGLFDRHPMYKKNTNPSRPSQYGHHEDPKRMPSVTSVTANFELCTSSASEKPLILLQFPNKPAGDYYNHDRGCKPLEIRIKPNSGVVEVDVPLNVTENFNKQRGSLYGTALLRTQFQKAQNDQPAGGGLILGSSRVNRTQGLTREARANLPASSQQGESVDLYMNKITLGGRIVPCEEGNAVYALAAFKKGKATWRRIRSTVQLRPQFTHLDVLNEENKSTTRTDYPSHDRLREDRAEDVNMVIKTSGDADGADMYGGMQETARLLRSIRDEPWQKLNWVNQEAEYSQEKQEQVLHRSVSDPQRDLSSKLTSSQYLDAISCPRVDSKTQGNSVAQSLGTDVDDLDDVPINNKIEATQRDSLPDTHNEEESEADLAKLPDGIARPDPLMERDIEKICRLVCMSSKEMQARLEHRFLHCTGGSSKAASKQGRPRFGFLQRESKFHAYYKWRVEQNCLGIGIHPDHDL